MKKRSVSILACAACAIWMAIPAIAISKPSVVRKAPAPETLSGKIMDVEPARSLVIVQDSNGVPFDVVVTHGTRITYGGQPATMRDLKDDMNKSVSIRFVPERKGDVAQSIRVGG